MSDEKKDSGHGGAGDKKKMSPGTLIGMAVAILLTLFFLAIGLSQFGEILWGSRMAIEGSFNMIVKIMMSFVPVVFIAILVIAVLRAINKKDSGAHH